jgi:UDP-N-acetyl-D-galactosamine dehydrogenase
VNKKKICIIGLGYVGLPLFVSFKKKYFNVCGYDVDKKRVLELTKGYDSNNEVKKKDLLLNNKSFLTSRIKDIEEHNIYIFALPTPINNKKIPDIKILTDATKKVSSILKTGDVIIYESTVYPGLTDDVLIPIVEKNSGLKLNKDFFCGYSPERINPGDKKHTLENISKIVSGSNKVATNLIFEIYRKIIKAKVYKASTIKHAEAAKVIENVQRDINISFVNELSILFNKLNINTREVL